MSHSRMVQATRARQYEVRMTESPLHSSPGPLLDVLKGRRTLVVCSPTVAKLYGKCLYLALREAQVDAHLLVLQCSEATKTVDQVVTVCKAAQDAGLDRRAALVAVGGGVVSDIVTLAASWIRRGVEHLRVPTTLIGQVDAGVGIKGAVNLGPKKNYIGVFHPPGAVLVDTKFLTSLPISHVRFGLAEVIKIALVRDPSLFTLVDDHLTELTSGQLNGSATVHEVVWRSIVSMVDELEPNLYEDQSYERLVDFGHTFSPTLEVASGYRLHHGAAVGIDMALSVAIAAECGMLQSGVRDRVLSLLRRVGLPICSPLLTAGLCEAALADAARHRGGSVNLVIPVTIGRAEFLRCREDIAPSVLKRGLEVLRQSDRESTTPRFLLSTSRLSADTAGL
jgi:3-dehydroquinate synthetase